MNWNRIINSRVIAHACMMLVAISANATAKEPAASDAKKPAMKKITQAEYQKALEINGGKIGMGGGKAGGWPAGMEDYKIRFIRLDHGGQGWSDGMNETNADMNFLREFSRVTGLKKIARKSESHAMGLLRKYPADGFPPFVYMTGNNNIGRVSATDIKALREYCLRGGMLLADAGDKRFHQSFVHLMRKVFPDKKMMNIPNDDMIHMTPYAFENGPPAFWHHGGRRPLGINHNGRWIVYYHPGDMNDAWKSKEHTNASPELRKAAMNLGVNIVHYAFRHWEEAINKPKK